MKVHEAAEVLSRLGDREVTSSQVIYTLRQKYPGRKWTTSSVVPQEYAQELEVAEERFHSTTESQSEEPVAHVEEGAIAKADEAIDAAAYRLDQTERATETESIQVREVQSEVLGEAAGVKSGLIFVRSYIHGKQSILNAVTNESIKSIDQILDEMDGEMIALAEEAGEWLGNSIRQQQATTQRLTNLRQRVRIMTKGFSKRAS